MAKCKKAKCWKGIFSRRDDGKGRGGVRWHNNASKERETVSDARLDSR